MKKLQHPDEHIDTIEAAKKQLSEALKSLENGHYALSSSFALSFISIINPVIEAERVKSVAFSQQQGESASLQEKTELVKKHLKLLYKHGGMAAMADYCDTVNTGLNRKTLDILMHEVIACPVLPPTS